MLSRLASLTRVPRTRSSWEVAIAALGVNLWVAFLLLPALHMERPGPGPLAWFMVALPLAGLAGGILLRRRGLLMGLYPALLLLATLAVPKLVSAGVYSPFTFTLMGASFMAYQLVTLYLTGLMDAPPVPTEGRDLAPVHLGSRWRRRLRIHRWMAALAVFFPAVLLATAFLHPGLQQDLQLNYPRRAGAARALVGVLTLALWASIFYAYFLVPLRAHVRGDPRVRRDVRRLRREAARGARPGLPFYMLVGAALGLMVLLLILRG